MYFNMRLTTFRSLDCVMAIHVSVLNLYEQRGSRVRVRKSVVGEVL